MQFSLITLAAIAASMVSAAPTDLTPRAAATIPYFSGFNMGANNPDGSCKTQAQWQAEFNILKNDWSAKSSGMTFDHVKLFSTADCNAFTYAIPAAIAAGVKVWAGVWNVDDAKFQAEKDALEAAIRAHGSAWLAGINVGSESFYREEITGDKLAQQIYDVKGMVQVSLNAPNVPVGTADTWTSWVDGRFAPVIAAVDVALMNGFPYWQGVTIDGGLDKFKEAIWNTRKAVGESKQIVIGETGWPSAGDKFGSAEATLGNEAAYWKAAACWLKSSGQYSWFFFSAFDEPNRESTVEKNFGVGNVNKQLKFDIKC